MIVDCAVYENGARAKESLDLDHALDAARARGGFVWIGLHEPTADEFATVAEAFDLHPLAVEDAIHAHQRPKLERYGDSLFMVFKPSQYVDAEEVVEVGQIMVFLGADFVVTVRHGSSALTDVRRVLEEDPDRLQWGPASVLYAIADKVVDDYAAVMGVRLSADAVADGARLHRPVPQLQAPGLAVARTRRRARQRHVNRFSRTPPESSLRDPTVE